VPAECFIAPCNSSSLFGEETVHQPTWSEPSKDSLVAELRQMYAERQSMAAAKGALQTQLDAYMRQWTWYSTGTSMLLRLKTQLEA